MDTSGRHSDDRKRSRSPSRQDDESKHGRNVKRHRSRSPHRQRHHKETPPKAKLPFRSGLLHKHDFESYRPLFADYLDLQKQLDITQLSKDELKGRWKSFLNKWNRGELAEGWYDPETKRRADERSQVGLGQRLWPDSHRHREAQRTDTAAVSHDEHEEDDEYGPPKPGASGGGYGPAIPTMQDLQYKRELAEEDHEAQIADLRYDRKQDRKIQKERLEELAPRAAPGTRERQLEKKRDTAMSNKSFAEAKEAGAEDIGDGDLIGDDGIEGFKAKMRAKEKQKSERELRKEEVLRVRAAEREERKVEYRRKEEKTMDMLRQLAQQRYGGS